MPADDLTTNKSAGALLRDSELEIATAKQPPIDLRTVPIEQWSRYLEHDVTVPQFIEEFIKSEWRRDVDTTATVHAMEQQVEQFHRVQPPYYIYMSVLLQQTGRPWKFVPDAGPYLTGFSLGKK